MSDCTAVANCPSVSPVSSFPWLTPALGCGGLISDNDGDYYDCTANLVCIDIGANTITWTGGYIRQGTSSDKWKISGYGGNGGVLSGNSTVQLFRIFGTLELKDLTVKDGKTSPPVCPQETLSQPLTFPSPNRLAVPFTTTEEWSSPRTSSSRTTRR